jgi:hypothetical protein
VSMGCFFVIIVLSQSFALPLGKSAGHLRSA